MRYLSRPLVHLGVIAISGAVLVGAWVASSNAAIPTITFTGTNTAGVECTSVPNPAAATISADETVELANRTTNMTTIMVNGTQTQFTIAPDSWRTVTLVVGTWAIALQPTCASGRPSAQAFTVTVNSVPAPAPAPAPAPSPSLSPSSPAPSPSPSRAPAAVPSKTAAPSKRATPHPSPRHAGYPSSAHKASLTAGLAAPSPSGVTMGPVRSLSTPEAAADAPNYLLTLSAMILIIWIGSINVRVLFRRRKWLRANRVG